MTAPAAPAVRPATTAEPDKNDHARPYDYLVLRMAPELTTRLERIHATGRARGVRVEYAVSFTEWCAGLLKDAAYADTECTDFEQHQP